MLESRVLNYDVRFDSQRFRALQLSGNANLDDQKEYIKRQLLTDIGERINVSESRTNYTLINGHFVAEGTNEPMIDILRRGRAHRRKNGNSLEDFAREDAEVSTFEKIDNFVSDPSVPIGTKIVVGSPPSGSYQLNFFDGFVKTDNNEMVSVRFFSNLTNEEYAQKFTQINSNYSEVFSKDISASKLLATPVVVPENSSIQSLDELKIFMLDDEKVGIDAQEAEEVIKPAAWLITSYINTLVENPQALGLLQSKYNLILRTVDGEKIENIKEMNDANIMIEGKIKPQEKAGGCGTSGATPGGEIFKSADFSASKNLNSKQEWFKCPDCDFQADGPVGNQCPNCGLTKEKYAKTATEVCN